MPEQFTPDQDQSKERLGRVYIGSQFEVKQAFPSLTSMGLEGGHWVDTLTTMQIHEVMSITLPVSNGRSHHERLMHAITQTGLHIYLTETTLLQVTS